MLNFIHFFPDCNYASFLVKEREEQYNPELFHKLCQHNNSKLILMNYYLCDACLYLQNILKEHFTSDGIKEGNIGWERVNDKIDETRRKFQQIPSSPFL